MDDSHGNLVFLALTTCPDESSARQIAQALVQERLAACVNRLPGIHSTYFWDGRLQEDGEVLLKTTAAQLAAIEARLAELHPYELPELLAWPATHGNERYLDWVRSGVAKKGT
jgi:periplasmic divalent cation tolerance protein